MQLSEVIEEGYRAFEEVRSQLEAAVRTEKRKEVLQTQIQQWLSQHNDLVSLSEATDKSIVVVDNVSANSTVLRGLVESQKLLGIPLVWK